MITEYRQLVFPRADIIMALSGLRKAQGSPLPAGSITKFVVSAEEAISVSIYVSPEKRARTSEEFTFNEGEIAAALVLYCVNQGIPLPAKSTKVLQLFGDTLILQLAINAKKSVDFEDVPMPWHGSSLKAGVG